jgi:hypothetical protein
MPEAAHGGGVLGGCLASNSASAKSSRPCATPATVVGGLAAATAQLPDHLVDDSGGAWLTSANGLPGPRRTAGLGRPSTGARPPAGAP